MSVSTKVATIVVLLLLAVLWLGRAETVSATSVSIKASSSSLLNALGSCKRCGMAAECVNVPVGFEICTEINNETCFTHGGPCSD